MLTAPRIRSAVFRIYIGFPCSAEQECVSVGSSSGSRICHKVSRVSILTAKWRLFSFPNAAPFPEGAASGQSICRKGEQPAAYSWLMQGGSHKPCNNEVIIPVFLFVLLVAAGPAASWQPFSPGRAFSGAPFPPDTGQNRISYRAYSA